MTKLRELVLRHWPAAVCVLGVLLVFSEAVCTNHVFYERDLSLVWYPRVTSVVRAIGQGAWPLWNPHTAFGESIAVDPSYQLWYPPYWLNFIIGPATYVKASTLLHALWTALGMLFLLRLLGLSKPAAALGGVAWMASGPWLSLVMHHHTVGATWAPWVLLAFLHFWSSGTWRSVILLALAAAAQLFGGSADMCMLTALTAPFLLALSDVGPRSADPRAVLGRLGRLLAAGGLTCALVAQQWLPTFLQIRATNRGLLQQGENMFWSLNPLEAAETMAPMLFRFLPWEEEQRVRALGSAEPFMMSIYFGVTTLPLVLVALASAGRRRKLALLAGLVLFAAGALGSHTPIYPALLHIPGLSVFRYPVKWLVAADILWIVSMAIGWEALGSPTSRARRARGGALAAALVSAAFLAAIGWLWYHRSDPAPSFIGGSPEAWSALATEICKRLLRQPALSAAGAALLLGASLARGRGRVFVAAYGLLAVGDLIQAGRGVNLLAPPELLAFRPPVIEHMDPEKDGYRIYSTAPRGMARKMFLAHGPLGWRPEWAWILGKFEAIRPYTSGRWGLHASFEGDPTGLADTNVVMASRMASVAARPEVVLKLLRIWNVRYVIGFDEPRFALLEKVGEWPSVAALPLGLWRVPGGQPRTYLVDRARAATGLEAVRQILDPSFDPAREIVVPRAEEARPGVSGSAGAAGTISRRADRVEIETRCEQSAYLVLVDTYDPGWSAAVDGQPAEIVRANLVARAVAVPAGTHRVVFRYLPRSFVIGLVLSCAGVVVALGGLAATRRRAVPPARESEP